MRTAIPVIIVAHIPLPATGQAAKGEENPAAPDPKAGGAVAMPRHRKGRKFVIDSPRYPCLDRQGAIARPHLHIRHRPGPVLITGTVPVDTNRMVRPGTDHLIHIGAKGQDLITATAAPFKADGDKGRVFHLYRAGFHRGLQPERPGQVTPQCGGEQADHRLARNGRATIQPRPVPADQERQRPA